MAFMKYMRAGGLIMRIILVLSATGAAIAPERIFFFARASRRTRRSCPRCPEAR